MATSLAWLLNLDAELELDDARRYRTSPTMEARIATLVPHMTQLLRPLDRVIGRDPDLSVCTGAFAFCPTPSARERIAAAGLTPPAAPDPTLLARVNGRAFCAALGQTLPGAAYVRSMDELNDVLAAPSPSGAWVLKRELAFAGRERRRVDGNRLDVPTEGFARRSFARGQGLQVEPWVARTDDFARHGYVLRSGRILTGPIMRQHCDERGAWQASEPLTGGDLEPADARALALSVSLAGEKLAEAGYFGPFGVDAYRFVWPDGRGDFQPRSEINARFSMGYPRDLLEQAIALSPTGQDYPPG